MLEINYVVVFDDVEYAELPFRDARNLVTYYRHQSQMIEETLRINNKRKKKNDQWFSQKKNIKKSKTLNHNDRRNHGINSSSDSYQCASSSHFNRHRHCLASFDHRSNRNGNLFFSNLVRFFYFFIFRS
jgi:hypothetical protein